MREQNWMHISNLQNTNKQKESNMKPLISLQSDVTVKCATTSENPQSETQSNCNSVTEQMAQCGS